MATKIWGLFFLLTLSITACGQIETIPPTQTTLPTPLPTPTPRPSSTPGPSPEAQAFLEEVFELVQTHALNRDKVDWDRLREKIYTDEMHAETTADTYDSVRHMLVWLNDRHSSFLSSEEAEWFMNLDTSAADNPAPESWLSEEGYAYLYIPQFASGDREVNNAYAQQLQQRVKALDASAPCAWVIDLRQNFGGNLFPMVAGLSGLIPDGEVSSLQFVDGRIETSLLKNGQFIDQGEVLTEVKEPLTGLSNPTPVIAILIGPVTSSSGEMLALSFKGLPNVTYFGHETGGYTTGNSLFTLSDGSIILLTTSIFIDRTGQAYGGSFQPDIPLETIAGYPKTIPPTVLEWLESKEACDS